ncbi:hypothetical protein HO173_005506 [Letharia columbiana]|uniref:Zn(2)-C6 fungal-type domain-containing protein n=1 Tax=Letharia columbiana TaxID=112416 RepID=A0A8H6FX82_9LECA|nr:uncharacterized protein HO173_005506 [Letharia columbiana]KAF6236414.1 hypothetical protein HO173_005506 [Letharia columbiana]
MVFRGKPSKACHRCRERRLKCDLVKPRCTQCLRAGRKCPGYRPQSNDRFLDQTAEVVFKARLAEDARTEQVQSDQAMTKELPRSLSLPIEARATSFLLSNFIQGSNFEYLPSLYAPYSVREEHLSASIEAVGLASLSNQLRSLQVSKQGRKRYIHAIQATNTALRSPVRATEDSTLLSVLLLSLYEAITCTTQLTLCLWESHIKGAMALIRLRGRQQMNTQLGLQLLSQTTFSVAISAHRNMAAVPTEITSLVTHGLQYASEDDPSWSLKLISFRAADLRAAIKSGSLSDPDVIIAAAMQLDHDFVLWSSTLPPSWQFKTVLAEHADGTLVYEGYYHLYSTHGIARSMNAWRMLRMQLKLTIREQILRQHTSPLRSQDYTTLMRHAESIITQLSSEICATIPQYVELPARVPISVSKTQPPHSTISDTPLPKTESSTSGFTHAARSYGIIWPLMSVATCPVCHSSRRAWIINRLQYIGRQMNNPQALLAVKILERNWDVDIRMHLCHLL